MAAKLIDEATTTGAGGIHKIKPSPNHTMQVVLVSGSLTALTVLLEGSLDGVTFFPLITHGSITDSSMAWAANAPVEYIRANITILTGTTPVISVYHTRGLALR